MKNIFVILLLVNLNTLFAQNILDLVQLSDSSIYKGKILEQNSQKIKLKTLCDNVLVFNTEDVTRVSSEPYSPKYFLKNRGYISYNSVGALIGSTANENRAPFSAITEHNYRINSYLAIGFLFGLEFLNEATVPLGGNIKLMLPIKNRNTLFIGGTAGYSYFVEKAKDPYYEILENHGGTMANIEAGIIIPSESNMGFFIAIGYRYNELSYTREDWYLNEVDRTIFYNRLSVRVGLLLY